MKYALACVFICWASAMAQQPVISPGGVVSAASYTAGFDPHTASEYPETRGGPLLAAESLASIFGENLATTTLSAQPPLPRELGGTSVSVNGVAAPLLFVSPNQINFQIPSGNDTTPGVSSAAGVVVATAAGQSAPYPLATGYFPPAPGIFTIDSSGCERGAVLNVAADGSVSLNSPTNSAAPEARGLTMYKAVLPAGSIKPGSFTISASGGTDVGAFQSTVEIGSPIQVITPLAGRVLHKDGPPLLIQWTGGDPEDWVTLKIVGRGGPVDSYPWAWVARASDGQITIQALPEPIGFAIGGPVELVMEVVPDPSQVPSIAAPNLSLGGRAQ